MTRYTGMTALLHFDYIISTLSLLDVWCAVYRLLSYESPEETIMRCLR